MENSTGRVRKKWSDNPMNIEMPISASAIKEHINPQYEHYLLLLQQRNRMLRKLMTKTSQEISLERKEQGFTLYMNGANAEMDINPTLQQLKSPSPNHEARSRRHRAAAQLMARRNRFFLDQNYMKELENDIQSRHRQRQAPLTKRSRKRWNIKSIKSRLAGMNEEENCRVSYEDDFESDDSLSSSDSEDDKDLIHSSTEEECFKVQSLENKLNNNNNYKRNQRNSPERKLTLSIADIKKLKFSLEMNSDLRKSIMEELSSGEESDCSIPEELNENDTNNSILGSVNLQQNFMKPADFIVLEFGTPSCSREKNVPSSKQKDYDVHSTTELMSHDKNTSLPGLRPENKIANDFIKFQLLGNSHNADHNHNHNHNQKQMRKHHSQFESLSGTLTEQEVNLITKNVLRMRPRQQVNLMKMLGKLEETADTEISERHKETGREHQNLVLHPHRKIRLELLSNRGHNKRIGLTEIQLYDTSGKIIPVLPENVTVKNASNPSNSILVIFNGKAKTSKLKNMWSCDKSDTASVTITIHPLAEKSLSKIKIWNYNHSMKNLNIGVNLIKVFINDKLLYSGSVEKGCGNHIFDFSTTIELCVSSDNYSSSSSMEVLTLINNDNLLKRHSSPDCGLSKNLRKRDTASSAPASRCSSIGRKRSISLSPLSPPLSAGNPVSRKHHLPFTNSHGEIIDDNKDFMFKKSSIVKCKSPYPSRKIGSPRDKLDLFNQKEPWDVLFSENNRNSPQDNSQKMSLDNYSLNGVPVSPRTHQNTANLDILPDATRSAGKKEKKSKHSLDWLENNILPKHLHCHDNHTSNCSRESTIETSSNYEVDIVDRLEEPLKDFQLSSPAKNGKSNLFDVHSLDEELETAHQSTIRLRNMLDKIEKQVSHSSRLGSFQEKEMLEPSSPGSVTSLRTILDEEFEKSKYDSLAEEMQEQEFGMYTPMQKIQKRRAKWRHLSESNLEESWGSLNYFNHLHRGRLSMDGDALDEYLLEDKVPVFQSESSISQSQQSVMLKADEDFTIPELPYGQELVINIKTTWGDKHYVGLTGIDIFSEKGEPVTVKKITANPKDINVLPQYNKDPRVVQNLIDGVNRTRDDVHMWLTPFTAGSNHYVTLSFTEPCHIALIRIWNYNKSRIHSFRGACEVDILLDRRLIFSGEIARACGGVEGGTEAFGDTILFSVEEEILEAVSRNDDAYEGETLEDVSWEDEIGNQRPTTAAQANEDQDRPFTRACGNTADLQDHMSTLDLMDSLDHQSSSVLKGKCLKLNFTETWGDLHYLGLTGLEVFSTDKETLPVNVNMLSAEPSDLHCLPGHEKDERTLDKLINGTNVTNADENMWLIPFTPGKPHIVCFEFPQPVTISGIRVWNYNKNPEDTYRGAKIVHVEIDGHTISPTDGYLIRKGLGSCPFDFGQEMSFSSTGHLSFGSKSPNAVKDRRCLSSELSSFCYETVSMPCGFIYQLQLFNTWGDPYYVGLNGIELYDSEFYKMPLDENNIAAYPDSVNVLTPNVQTDIRTPDKLVDGENDTKDGVHMWLAPVLPSVVNKVYIIFDQPTTVSMIKIWNYRKTPSRAAKDIALLVDDLLVCNGSLPAVNNASRGILPTCDMPHPYYTLLFTENKEVLKRERHTIISNYTPLTQGQEIQMTNDRKIVTYDNSNRGKQQNVNQAMRPTTCVTNPTNKRPF